MEQAIATAPTKWAIRKATEQDISFIYATWLNSYRTGSQLASDTKKSIFFDNYKQVIDQILIESEVHVACLIDDLNVIIGYSVSDLGLLHYIFVKEAFREMGVAKSLYQWIESPTVFTHRTNSIEKILSKHAELIYNPFALMIN